VPGLEQLTTQYPLQQRFTILYEVLALCQGRDRIFLTQLKDLSKIWV